MFALSNNAARTTRRAVCALAAASLALIPLAAHAQTPIQSRNADLFASDGANSDWFGVTVAVSGESLLVAANFDDIGNKSNQGSCYYFDGNPYQQLAKLVALDGAATDRFGEDIALHGNMAIIGSVGADFGGIQNRGAAYLFNVATNQQLLKLAASDAGAGDQFGVAVELTEERAIVGAFLADVSGRADQGAVYTFDPVTGQQLLKITAGDGAAGDQFGLSLSASDGKVLVGAAGDDIGKNADQGSAYVFDLYTGQQIAKLIASDGKANARFGIDVALENNLALVGAALINQSNWAAEGLAYLYNATTGQQLAKLRASDGSTGNLYGQSVALHGKYALIGARLDDYDGKTNVGSAYLYDISDPTRPVELVKYIPADGKNTDQFGDSVALTDTKVIIGSRYAGSKQQGGVYVFPLPIKPVISDVSVANVTNAAATVIWQTQITVEQNKVEYGTTPDYGTTVAASGGGSHSASLPGLTPSTLYYFRVTSGSGASETTATGSFVTAKPAGNPVITLTGATLTRNGAQITATVTLTNAGDGDATDIVVSASTLGVKATTRALPFALGPVAAGAAVTTTLTFQDVPAGTATLKLSGTYTGGDGGAFSLNRRVTVP